MIYFCMQFESSNTSGEQTVSKAIAQIAGIESQARVMGANDYEPNAFESIRLRLTGGDITPKEAILEAQRILESKQDYH